MKPLLSLVVLVTACAVSVGDLPTPPVDLIPIVEDFAPHEGVPGVRVRITGRGFGPAAKVRFGDRGETTPVAVAQDGTSLEALVPEDAATGFVSVLVGARSGVSDETFTFGGLDRLRAGVITRTIDLRPPISRAFALGGTREFLVFAGPPYDAAFASIPEFGPLPIRNVYELALAPVGPGRLAVVSFEPEVELAGCEPSDLRVTLVDAPFGDRTLTKACLPSGGDDPGQVLSIAMDKPGTHALVLSEARAWLVDFTADPITVGALDVPGIDPWTDVTWVGDTRFAIAVGAAVRFVDWTRGTLGARVVVTQGEEGNVTSLAWKTDGTLAAGTDQGRVVLLDLTPDDPARLALADTRNSATVTSVALTGNRLAAVQASIDRVLTFDLAQSPPRGLGAVEVPSAGRASVGLGGTFVVGSLGGVLLVASDTGALFERRRLPAGLHGPTRRTLVTETAGTGPVVEVASTLADRVVRLDPSTFEADAASDLEGPAERTPVTDLAASAGAGVLVLRRGDALLTRSNAQVGTSEAPGGLTLPEDSYLLTRLGLSRDGRALSFLLGGAGDHDVAVIEDTAAEWTGRDPHTFGFEGEKVLGVACDARTCVLQGDTRLRLLDRAAALSGTVTRVGVDLELQGNIQFAAYAPFGLYFATPGRLFSLDTTTALATDLGPWPVNAFPPSRDTDHPTFSPGGRRLYWLDDTAGGRRLRVLSFDPDTHTPLREEPALTLPPGVDDFLVQPGGEQILALDAQTDQIHVFE